MTKTITREYYLLLALKQAGVCVFSATYVTFLLSKGLDLFQVNLVNTVFFITLFVCEIPTGAFADVFGRKKSYVVSCTLYALSLYLYALSDTFLEFILAEMVGAVAATFASGAFDAWFVDRLRHHGHTESLQTLFSRGTQIARGVGLCAAVGGAFAADYSQNLPWILGGSIFVLMGLITVFTMKEEYFVPKEFSFVSGWRQCKETVKTSFVYSVKSANVRFVVIAMILLNFATMAPNMQWQPFFQGWFGNQASLGFLYASITCALMLGAWLVPMMLKRWNDEKKMLLFSLGIVGIGLIGAGVTTEIAMALVAFLIHEVGRGAIIPLKDAYLHDHIPSKERSTIVSFESIGHHLGGAVGLVVSGFVALHSSISVAWILSGGCLMIAAFVLWKRR